MRQAWCTVRHSGKFHEHVTVTSPRPRRLIIFCSGAGNNPPDRGRFPDAVVYCITGGSSFALTGTLSDGWDGKKRTLDHTDLAIALVTLVFWDEFMRINAFHHLLTTDCGKGISVQPPSAHFRPTCVHVLSQVRQRFQVFFEWTSYKFEFY